MNEVWSTVLFLIVIPLLQQGIKLYQDKTGKTLDKLANQIVSLVLAGIFAVVSGGFAGLGLPGFPVWAGDLIGFVNGLFSFMGEWVVLLGAAWGSLMAVYELVWDRLFVKVNLATADKL